MLPSETLYGDSLLLRRSVHHPRCNPFNRTQHGKKEDDEDDAQRVVRVPEQ